MTANLLCSDLAEASTVDETVAASMRFAVGIATAGRPAMLTETLREIAKQNRLPDIVVICPRSEQDVESEVLETLPYACRVVSSKPGTCRQRNAILRAVQDCDAVVFFDDDFFPAPTYLANAEAILQRDDEVVAMSGTLLEDGIHGLGIKPEAARARIASAPARIPSGGIRTDYGTYGCNMVFRLAPVREHKPNFDEGLPLYGWQEDIDFSRQMAKWGRVVRADALTGVHLGIKGGRTSGVKFGYSQVANPIYLMRKGTVSLSFGGKTLVKNVLANAARAIRPEARIDRAGRFKGNMLAFVDLLRGRMYPGRICELE
jgi:GT2 family glycosyltransferase